MKRKLFLSCLVAAAVAVPVSSSHALVLSSDLSKPNVRYVLVNADDPVSLGAETFITKLADDGIGFLADETITTAKQKAAFRKLLNRNFDLNTIARFSLGRHWRTANKAQRDEYVSLFKDMIVDVYSQRFSDYEGQTLTVSGSRKEGERDILVHSLLEQDAGPDVKVDWRVRKRDGRYKVVDVIVEGVSMALTQRSDFSSVVQRGGGKMEALLAHLREK